MKNLFFIASVLLFAYCQPTTNASITTNTDTNMEDYIELPSNTKFKKWVDKKIAFEATLAKMQYQHMLRRSINGPNTYVTIEPAEKYGLGQILAYTIDRDNIKDKYKGKTFTVYGTLGVISGAGKGGGTHTEYYLELDSVE